MSSKRKTAKRIFSDCMTILTVIAIFVFSISCIVFIIFTFISAPASAATEKTEKSAAAKFQEAMQYINSHKNIVSTEENNIKAGSFKLEPGKTFSDPKTKKSWYTNSPTQTGYYSETQSNTYELEKASREEVTKDEDYKDAKGNPVPTPGKAVTESFKTRPIFKISQKEEYIKKSKLVETNANNVVMGESNKHIDCKNKKMSACKIIQVEKTCNEEVRTIRRVCDKVADVTTYVRDIVFPGCKSVVVTQGAGTTCPGGYREELYMDMLDGPTNDDARICAREISVGESSECLGGYLVYGSYGRIRSTERVIVPRKLHARAKVTHAFRATPYYDCRRGISTPMRVTVSNEKTGEKIKDNAPFGTGDTFDLPYSDTQDQTFSFYTRPTGRLACGEALGVMVFYVEHLNKEKVANDPVWRESCRDI